MSEIVFRRAIRADVPVIVALLADDAINGHREKPGIPVLAGYLSAFEAIDKDTSQTLIVGEMDGAVIATAQLTIIPTMTQQGTPRALIESVRVSSQARSGGIGEKLIDHMHMLAKARGATALQLTTSNARVDAQRFYKRIGFSATHLGFKREMA